MTAFEQSISIADRVRAATGTFTPGPLRRLNVATMLRDRPPIVPWLVEPLLVRGALTLLAGREGQGKSLLAQAIASAVAGGDQVAGLGTRKGRVMIVDAENGEAEIHRRVHALGLDPEVADQVAVFESDGYDLRDLDPLAREIDAFRPDLLVLDSFRSLWAGDENKSDETGAVLDRLRNLVRRHGAATMLLHHTGKSGLAYRGSSGIGASCELVFLLGREEEDPDPARRYVRCWKSRPAPEPPRIWLRLTAELDMVVVEQCAPPDDVGEQTATPRRDEVTEQVIMFLSATPATRPDTARGLGRTPKDGTVRRVFEKLEKNGVIVANEACVYAIHEGVPSASTL